MSAESKQADAVHNSASVQQLEFFASSDRGGCAFDVGALDCGYEQAPKVVGLWNADSRQTEAYHLVRVERGSVQYVRVY
jgi:hypothetical protein